MLQKTIVYLSAVGVTYMGPFSARAATFSAGVKKYLGAATQGSGERKFPMGSRSEAIFLERSLQKLKQFADVAYRF